MFEAETSPTRIDEIKNYLDCRYLSTYESCWRLFEFPIHHREPSVQRLFIHLPEEHNIYFSETQSIPGIILIPAINKTIFTEWMTTNELDEKGRSLLYYNFPTKFTWHQKQKKWEYRMGGKSISRIIYVHPCVGGLYYLCLLLNESKGARNYEDLRTINGVGYTTYKEACFVLGLLGDDLEWSNALRQASHWATGNLTDHLFQEELNYNIGQLQINNLLMLSKLNAEQLAIYKEVKEAINSDRGEMFFVCGYKGKIVFVVASSGIASLLLHGGRTVHSRFKIPINIEEYSTCRISKQTQLARLIEEATLIVFDEAPMIHRNCLEALNKTLQDLLSDKKPKTSTRPFGGKTLVLGEDFHQILLVIKYRSKIDIINAAITQSYLWQECKRDNLDDQSRNQLRQFTEWLLQVGNDTIMCTENNDNTNEERDWIEILKNLLIKRLGDPIDSIIEFVYSQFHVNYVDLEYLRQCAIITPYNDTVKIINDVISQKIQAPEQIYLSSDYISKASTSVETHGPLYSIEFLNTLKFVGIPNHELTLKLGCVIMLMRNICQANGLCNGTRLIVTQLYPNILEAMIISGPVFSHGQLYMVLTQVTSAKELKNLVVDEGGGNTNKTRNVVYQEFFTAYKAI
ncbi:DNA helicase protein [Dioscorea alata]|uniref:DNA helicase protein n=1 Tax=Dioscorea alata TaxID=55571 RepID=A0ACB7ULF7_DIOAL|nr:DNA helicase protein [Dioscorea alata]